jgi:hypothetical protein
MAKAKPKDFIAALERAYRLEPDQTVREIVQHIEKGWTDWSHTPSKGGLPNYLKREVEKSLKSPQKLIFGQSYIDKPKGLSPKDSIEEPHLLVDYHLEWEDGLKQDQKSFWIGSKEHQSNYHLTPINYYLAYFTLNRYHKVYDPDYWYKLAVSEFNQRMRYQVVRWNIKYDAKKHPYFYETGFYYKNSYAPSIRQLADYALVVIRNSPVEDVED